VNELNTHENSVCPVPTKGLVNASRTLGNRENVYIPKSQD